MGDAIMQIIQKQDGGADIIFSEEELKILNKNKKLYLDPEGLRHFGNYLVKIVSDWYMKSSDEIKKLETKDTDEIKGK